MTPLKARHERFCRWFVELANAAGAARAAGYAPKAANRAGYRLLRHPRIALRIAEIEAETARLHSRDGEVLLGKLENVYRRAIVDHQFHAAIRAVGLQSRIHGMTAPVVSPSAGAGGNDHAGCGPKARAATGGRRPRAPARGDLRRPGAGETGLGGTGFDLGPFC